MVDILANGVVINIEGGQWRMFNSEGKHTLSPFFTAMRGEGLIRYTPEYGVSRGLPGNILATDYIKAVVVGLDPRRNCWSLGLQVALHEEDKPFYAELVNWPDQDDKQFAIDCHTAGRILGEYLSTPLKMFGVKKNVQANQANPRATVTGPLVPHDREDVDGHKVKLKASNIGLPLTLGDIWLGQVNKNTVTLRLPKEAIDKDNKTHGEAPAYQQCVIDTNALLVKLMPPTGLLGAFFGPQGRAIKFEQIRNVEFRHNTVSESTREQNSSGTPVDTWKKTHEYGVYLTIADESLLVLKAKHVSASTLKNQKMRVRSTDTIDVERVKADMRYYDQHEQDQAKHDKVSNFAEAAAYVIAASLNKALVKTTVGDQTE